MTRPASSTAAAVGIALLAALLIAGCGGTPLANLTQRKADDVIVPITAGKGTKSLGSHAVPHQFGVSITCVGKGNATIKVGSSSEVLACASGAAGRAALREFNITPATLPVTVTAPAGTKWRADVFRLSSDESVTSP